MHWATREEGCYALGGPIPLGGAAPMIVALNPKPSQCAPRDLLPPWGCTTVELLSSVALPNS